MAGTLVSDMGRGAGARVTAEDNAAFGFTVTIVSLAISVVMIAMPVAAHAVHPMLGILLAFGLAAACAWRMPQVALVAILFAFFFQNLFVSMMADTVRSKEDFDIIRAYNFLILCVTWLVTALRFLAHWRERDPAVDPYIKLSVTLMIIIGVYFLIGFVSNGMTAVVYLRNFITPFLLFQICLVLFAAYPIRLAPSLTALGMLAAACGFVEFAARDSWLAMTNGYTFWELSYGPNWATLAYDEAAAETGRVSTGLTDSFRIDFFNSPLFAGLAGPMMRLFGPNMHAISFAYGLTFLLVFALFRGRWAQAAMLFVLVFLCNAKGPLITLVLLGCGWIVFRLFGAGFSFLMLGLALLGYAFLGVLVGLSVGDYHVLGLMAAIYEFPANPIGHGIGNGGNLSPLFTTIDWQQAQADGRTPFAVESSAGVMLYQLGVFAFAVIGGYIWIAWRIMRIARETGNDLHAAASLALLAMVANGLFQEEAYFSPLALALFLGLAGMIIGAAIRGGLEQTISR